MIRIDVRHYGLYGYLIGIALQGRVRVKSTVQ